MVDISAKLKQLNIWFDDSATAPDANIVSGHDIKESFAIIHKRFSNLYGLGKQIAAETDLNTLTEGMYHCIATNTSSLVNCPVTSVAFTLYCIKNAYDERYTQIIIPQERDCSYFFIRGISTTGWGNWYKYEGNKPGESEQGKTLTYNERQEEGDPISVTVTGVQSAEIFNDYTNNIAAGEYSHAEGNQTIASGVGSHSEGYDTQAQGDYSHAEGYSTTASEQFSHAEGGNTAASGIAAHAEGGGTQASGQSSHAEGAGTTASGVSSHAEGACTTASGNYSHTEGQATAAVGECSHASGTYTIAKQNNEFVIGKYNVETQASSDSKPFIIGNGTTNSRSNAFAIDWNGNIYVGSDTTGIDVRLLKSTPLVTFGTCNTAAATKDKVVTITDTTWIRRVGSIVYVKYAHTNTYSATSTNHVTLNVNGTGAADIYYNTSNAPTGTQMYAYGTANRIVAYIWDGTRWCWIGHGADNNTTYSAITEAEIRAGTSTTSRLVTPARLNLALYGLGVALENGDDLNDSSVISTTIGNRYYGSTTTICNSIKHRPNYSNPTKIVFMIETVITTGASRMLMRMYTRNTDTNETNMFYRSYGGTAWGSWKQVTDIIVSDYT